MDRDKLHTVVDELADGVNKASDKFEEIITDALEVAKKGYDRAKHITANKFQLNQVVSVKKEEVDFLVIGIYVTRSGKLLYTLISDEDTILSNIIEEDISVTK